MPRANDGTHLLHSGHFAELCDAQDIREKLRQATQRPERNARIGAAKRGTRHTPQTKAKISRAKQGRKHTAEARRNMSAGQRRRAENLATAKGPPWTAEDEALLGTAPDEQVAIRLGRTFYQVRRRRRRLRIPSYIRHKPHAPRWAWTAEEDRLLGTMSDAALAERLGCLLLVVFRRRRKLGIPAHQRQL